MRRNEFRHETISRGARSEKRQRPPAPDAEAGAPCAAADLVHGAVVYAPPDGDAVADGEEGGDAMADEEEG